MKYNVFWKENLIGVLIVENDFHNYTPTEIATKLPLEPVLQKKYSGKELPFFKTRIEASNKNPNLEEIGFHTDFYTLKKSL